MSNNFYWIAVVLATIAGSARLTRLATWDKFPPVAYLRDKYADLTDGSDWQVLAFCGYCASFWVTAIVVFWGLFAGVYDGVYDDTLAEKIWWLTYFILGASYAAAITMANDGDDGDEN